MNDVVTTNNSCSNNATTNPSTSDDANNPLKRKLHHGPIVTGTSYDNEPIGVISQSIIECGVVEPSTGERVLYENSEYFNHQQVDIYTALSDPDRERLYRVSALCEKFGCKSSSLCMYISRRKKISELDGLYQAIGFEHRPAKQSGLKTGNYFLSMKACKMIETKFIELANRRKKRKMKCKPSRYIELSNMNNVLLADPSMVHFDSMQQQQQQQQAIAAAAANPYAGIDYNNFNNYNNFNPMNLNNYNFNNFNLANINNLNNVNAVPTNNDLLALLAQQQQQQQSLQQSLLQTNYNNQAAVEYVHQLQSPNLQNYSTQAKLEQLNNVHSQAISHTLTQLDQFLKSIPQNRNNVNDNNINTGNTSGSIGSSSTSSAVISPNHTNNANILNELHYATNYIRTLNAELQQQNTAYNPNEIMQNVHQAQLSNHDYSNNPNLDPMLAAQASFLAAPNYQYSMQFNSANHANIL
jgi:Tfp pilus assembly protein PilP